MERGVQRAHGVTRRGLAHAREKAMDEGCERAHQHATAEAVRKPHVFEISLSRRTWVLEE
jgi:hypothetical protein